tara:strand:- start:164 stop:577 length:414 start_codon:yes stop_codon:yes gene_type:complete
MTLTKEKAIEVMVSVMKENFGDRKETTREFNGKTIVVPGFPEEVKSSDRFREDLGLDSLDLTELAMDAEEKYSEITGQKEIYFDAAVLQSIYTVDDAASFFVQASEEMKSMSPEEYKEKVKKQFSFTEMGLKEKDEL